MDKNTLLAVVLSVVVISVGFFIQALLAPPSEEVTTEQQRIPQQQPTSETEQPTGDIESAQETETQKEQPRAMQSAEGVTSVTEAGEEAVLQEIKAVTDIFDITFSTRGAEITSLQLKEHKSDDQFVEMIFTGDSDRAAFGMGFGETETPLMDTLFHFNKPDEYTYEFYRDFRAPSSDGTPGDVFRLKKTFVFKPGEYLFQLKITVENSVNEIPNLNFNGNTYSLYVGPQVGPKFETLDPRRREYRKFFYYSDGNRDNIKISREGLATLNERFLWAGVAGKYFAIIGVPDATQYQLTCRQTQVPGLPEGAEMFFSRPPLQSSKNTDVFYFYVGPKQNQILTRYNNLNKNSFQVKDLNLDTIADRNRILGWLESILKFFLEAFYKIVPNYGVAIIMLTVLVKVILFPFTRKSYESTSKMQTLSPKINELKEKYKNDPKKMNKEMAEIYKKEGVSPLGGCLPMLLQLPVFIALYGLLNNHFELRGAAFIKPWITDLSMPESIWNFAPVTLPLLGWSDLRLLPILFVSTQLVSSKIMQTPNTSAQGNMKLMTYALPIVFFFVLYDVPSGLLLYWIVTNVLTVLQQLYIAHRKKAKT